MKRKIAVWILCFSLICAFPVYSASAQDTQPVSFGDIDFNTAVNTTDALLTLRIAVSSISPTVEAASRADVDCSGKVNTTDALLILRYAVHKITAFAPTGLSGQTFIIGTSAISKYSGDSPVGRAYLAKIAEIEKKYSCTIQVVSATADEMKQNRTAYDIGDFYLVDCRNAARQSRVVDLTQIVPLQLSQFDGSITGSCTMGSGVYGIGTKAMSANAMGIVMNLDLLEKYAPVASAKLSSQFADGSWTWDAFIALMTEYRSNAGNVTCFESNTNIIGQAIVSNAGYEVIFDQDGTGAHSSISSPQGIEAMTYTKSLLTGGYWNYEADVSKLYSDFHDQKTPMLVFYLDAANTAADAGFSMTCMPFPRGPEQNSYVMCNFTGTAYTLLARSGKTGNAAAVILNELSTVNAQLAEAQVQSAASIGYDTLGQAVYGWTAENTSSDFSSGPFTAAVGTPVDSSILDPTMDPADVLPGIASVIQNEVDSYYGRFYISK